MLSYEDFLSASPTSYHAVEQIVSVLDAAGFREQDETEAWQGLSRGYVVRDGSVIAWIRGADDTLGFKVVGTHTDSPTFQLKPNPDGRAFGFSQVNVEVYGGMLPNSWFNRDLGIAGCLVTLGGDVHLVKTGPIMVIPQLAIHLDRSQMESVSMSRQRDLHPIWATGDRSIFEYVCGEAGVDPETVASMDLFAYDTQGPARVGEFIASGRQDNLSSTWAGIKAFIEADSALADATADDATQASDEGGHGVVVERGETLVFASFDHEEVGSSSYNGAAGPFLEAILRRLGAAIEPGEEAFQQMLANSTCVSADAGHSINPNRPEKHDPDHHPVLGGGPMLKINANQRYATEAVGAAMWLRACHAADVPAQEFVSNNDIPCGSTIGPITSTRLGILTVDVGAPLLSMHSVRELSHPDDVDALSAALREYLLA